MSDPVVNDSLKEILTKLNKLDTLEEKVGRIEVSLNEDVKELKTDVDVMKVEWKDYKTSQDIIKRSENIVVYGLRAKDKPTIISEFLEVCKHIGIEDVRKYDIRSVMTSRSAQRPVTFTLVSNSLRIDILTNKGKLASSNTFGHIRIRDDHPPEVRRVRGLLFPYMTHYRKQGLKVSLRNDKLVVDGVLRTLEDLKNSDVKVNDTEPKSFPPGRGKGSFRRDTRETNENKPRRYSRNNSLDNNGKARNESDTRGAKENITRRSSRKNSLENIEKGRAVSEKESGSWWQQSSAIPLLA